MSEQIAIQVNNLYKNFGENTAIKGLDLMIRKGEIFSLLGPNGAGKSTTISILTGLLSPTSGSITIMGNNIANASMRVRQIMGVVPQDIAVYEDLTARQNLQFWGRMYGLKGKHLRNRVNDVLQLISLGDRQNEASRHFSGGMKRRLNIGIALLHQPEIVIMDEPTVGIDPQSRRRILDGIKELNNQGITILYTTHYMEEAEELSDRIAIMDHGKIIAQGTHRELVNSIGTLESISITLSHQKPELLETWRMLANVHSVSNENDSIQILAHNSIQLMPALFNSANQQKVGISGIQIQEPNLESVFMHLTGKALRE